MSSWLLLALLAQPVTHLHDTDVLLDERLVPDTEATAVVVVRRASSLFEQEALEGAVVELTVDGERAALEKTDADGRAVLRFIAPRPKGDRAKVVIRTSSTYGTDRIERTVMVSHRPLLTLRTDRTIYGPGQTIHYLALLMNRVTARPLAGRDISLTVKDPKGTQIWRGVEKSDATGFVAKTLPLGEDLVLGKYTIEAEAKGAKASAKVEVREVELPPFFVEVDEANGRVTARYPYGEPVKGAVTIRDEKGKAITGQLDANGRFDIDLSKMQGDVQATVTDGARRTQSAALVRKKDDTPIAAPSTRRGRARNNRGASVQTDQLVYTGRRSIRVKGRFANGRAPVVLTLLRSGAALASAVVTPANDGTFEHTIVAPDGMFGLATLRALAFDWDSDPARARITRNAWTSLYLAPERLSVVLDGPTRHEPGSTTAIRATVRDSAGRPAGGVGLFASVIDERALALGARQPTLEELMTKIDFSSAAALGARFAELLERDDSDQRAREARDAIVRSLPTSTTKPFVRFDGLVRLRAERQRIYHIRGLVLDHYARSTGRLGVFDQRTGWRHNASLETVLARIGVKKRSTPWGRPIDWSYATALSPNITFDALAREVTQRRLQQLATILAPVHGAARRAAYRKRPANVVHDAWSHAIVWYPNRVRSPGPDGLFDTNDDLEFSLERSGSYGYGGLGARGSGHGGGGFGLRTGVVSALGRRAAPLRERFDEAVLWRSGLRTDGAGQAAIEVPFSDSVTGWRLAVDAVSPRGAVGRAEKHLETFLPLSVDVLVPTRLTTGDRYTLRAVVSNHTDETKALRVAVRIAGALVRHGPAEHAVTVPAGATAAVSIPTTANQAGPATVDLVLASARGEEDRVRRETKVVGPGRVQTLMVTHRFAKDRSDLAFEIPEAPEANSASATLRLFRTPLDQALDGIDRLLKEPHGCFEQTSSTTYPNLLVLQLLDDDSPKRQRAFELVQKGYQRLISYEVDGGGFSWFGQAPAHKALTAYGLMEFADMAKVYPVDPQLIARTQRWLIAQQNDDGSWAPDDRQLHDWSAVMGRTSATAFVVWALAESGYRGAALQRGLRYLGHHAPRAKSPYVTALHAAALAALDRDGRLPPSRAADEGLVYEAGGQTLFYAKGRAADVQVTALAAMAHARRGRASNAHASFRWLWSAREARYGWGTPQGTVMALKAAVEIADEKPATGVALVRFDDRSAERLPLDSVDVPTLSMTPTQGRHAIDVRDAEGLFADLRVSWRSKTAARARTNGIRVRLRVPQEAVAIGDTAAVTLTLDNPTDVLIAMPTVVVPIPPGFVPDEASLKRLRGRIDRVESTGDRLTFYLTKLAPGQSRKLTYRLTATAQCDVAHRAATAYAYYDPSVFSNSDTHRISAGR